MESSGIQRLFYVAWTLIKLNLYFILFTLAGGVVLGVGPAFQTLNDLLNEYGMNYQEITLAHFWSGWRRNFGRANRHFWLFALVEAVLGYNLYLVTQLTGILWLAISFVLVFTMALMVAVYGFTVLYETSYQISTGNLVKLAFISLFLRLSTFFKILFGVASIIIVTWQFKGLFVFATFSLLAIWGGYATKECRQLVDRKLVGRP